MQKSWAIAAIVGVVLVGVSASAQAQSTITETRDNFGPPAYNYSSPLSAGKSVKFVGTMSYNARPADYGDEVRFILASPGIVTFKQTGSVRAYVQVYRLNANGSKTYLNSVTTRDLSGQLSAGTYGIQFTLNARQTNYAMTVRR